IRHFLKNQRHHQSIALGRRMLNRALADIQMDLDQLTEEQLAQLLQAAQVDSLDRLLEEIGLGNRIAFAVAKLLQPDSPAKMKGGSIYSPLTIDSADGMLITFARCCRPIPGDPIIGHISSGKGLVIHQETCRNIAEIHSNP